MSRIRTQVRLGSEVGAETVEIDVHASIGHGIDLTDQDQVTAVLALHHPMLLDLVRSQLHERGVSSARRRSAEILDARLVDDDPPAPRPALTAGGEGWTVTEVQVRETTTYTITVAHPPGATHAEIAAVGYHDFSAALHPDAAFPHAVGPDEITVAGEPQHDPDLPWPAWAEHRPAATTDAQARPPVHG